MRGSTATVVQHPGCLPQCKADPFLLIAEIPTTEELFGSYMLRVMLGLLEIVLTSSVIASFGQQETRAVCLIAAIFLSNSPLGDYDRSNHLQTLTTTKDGV